LTERAVFGYSVADLSLDFRSEWVYPDCNTKRFVVSLFWRFEDAIIERKARTFRLSQGG
jgi:hypothetical protein